MEELAKKEIFSNISKSLVDKRDEIVHYYRSNVVLPVRCFVEVLKTLLQHDEFARAEYYNKSNVREQLIKGFASLMSNPDLVMSMGNYPERLRDCFLSSYNFVVKFMSRSNSKIPPSFHEHWRTSNIQMLIANDELVCEKQEDKIAALLLEKVVRSYAFCGDAMQVFKKHRSKCKIMLKFLIETQVAKFPKKCNSIVNDNLVSVETKLSLSADDVKSIRSFEIVAESVVKEFAQTVVSQFPVLKSMTVTRKGEEKETVLYEAVKLPAVTATARRMVVHVAHSVLDKYLIQSLRPHKVLSSGFYYDTLVQIDKTCFLGNKTSAILAAKFDVVVNCSPGEVQTFCKNDGGYFEISKDSTEEKKNKIYESLKKVLEKEKEKKKILIYSLSGCCEHVASVVIYVLSSFFSLKAEDATWQLIKKVPHVELADQKELYVRFYKECFDYGSICFKNCKEEIGVKFGNKILPVMCLTPHYNLNTGGRNCGVVDHLIEFGMKKRRNDDVAKFFSKHIQLELDKLEKPIHLICEESMNCVIKYLVNDSIKESPNDVQNGTVVFLAMDEVSMSNLTKGVAFKDGINIYGVVLGCCETGSSLLEKDEKENFSFIDTPTQDTQIISKDSYPCFLVKYHDGFVLHIYQKDSKKEFPELKKQIEDVMSSLCVKSASWKFLEFDQKRGFFLRVSKKVMKLALKKKGNFGKEVVVERAVERILGYKEICLSWSKEEALKEVQSLSPSKVVCSLSGSPVTEKMLDKHDGGVLNVIEESIVSKKCHEIKRSCNATWSATMQFCNVMLLGLISWEVLKKTFVVDGKVSNRTTEDLKEYFDSLSKYTGASKFFKWSSEDAATKICKLISDKKAKQKHINEILPLLSLFHLSRKDIKRCLDKKEKFRGVSTAGGKLVHINFFMNEEFSDHETASTDINKESITLVFGNDSGIDADHITCIPELLTKYIFEATKLRNLQKSSLLCESYTKPDDDDILKSFSLKKQSLHFKVSGGVSHECRNTKREEHEKEIYLGKFKDSVDTNAPCKFVGSSSFVRSLQRIESILQNAQALCEVYNVPLYRDARGRTARAVDKLSQIVINHIELITLKYANDSSVRDCHKKIQELMENFEKNRREISDHIKTCCNILKKFSDTYVKYSKRKMKDIISKERRICKKNNIANPVAMFCNGTWNRKTPKGWKGDNSWQRAKHQRAFLQNLTRRSKYASWYRDKKNGELFCVNIQHKQISEIRSTKQLLHFSSFLTNERLDTVGPPRTIFNSLVEDRPWKLRWSKGHKVIFQRDHMASCALAILCMWEKHATNYNSLNVNKVLLRPVVYLYHTDYKKWKNDEIKNVGEIIRF